MPIGFAKSILAQGTTATGANAFVDYDGSNDQTFTRNAAVQGFLGFAAFNDEYGVSMHITDAGGSSNDLIRYDVLRNNSGTLSITSQDQTISTSNSSNYTGFNANIVPTNSGNIYAYSPASPNNTGNTFSISGATVTRHDTFNSAQSQGIGGRMYRRPGTDQYVHMRGRATSIVTLTDNGNSSSTSDSTAITFSSSDMFYNNARTVNGFKDANTVIQWKTIEDSPSTNINSVVPCEVDLTTTGSQSLTAISGVSSVALTMGGNVSQAFDFGQAGSSHFETTDFNSTAMFFERRSQGSTGQLKIHHYTPGDSSVTSSNALTYSAGSDSDISPSGVFVGANNDVFLFAHLQDPNNMIILKFVKSTNTLSEITRINESFNVEKCRMSRWGDGAALLTYNDVKMRLIKP